MGDIYIWACVQADVANKVIYIWDMPLFISVRGGPGLAPVSHYSPKIWIWDNGPDAVNAVQSGSFEADY